MDGICDAFRRAVFISVEPEGRAFVKYSNQAKPLGRLWIYRPHQLDITLTVVIPTADAYRGGYLFKLLEQIEAQGFAKYELIVIKGDSRQGRAINSAAALAKGKYMLTLDDDSALPDEETFAKLVKVLDTHTDIGIAGGNNTIPDNTRAFVRRVMQEIPRRSWPPVKEITESDLAEHPCMIMRTAEFKKIGGENELVPRGLDPYLRQAFRGIGKRVVLVPDVIYHHLPPETMIKLLRQFYRNGRQAAYANRHYPQWVIETPATHGHFEPHRPFLHRFFRFPLRLFKALLEGKIIFFMSETAYATGFISEWIRMNNAAFRHSGRDRLN